MIFVSNIINYFFSPDRSSQSFDLVLFSSHFFRYHSARCMHGPYLLAYLLTLCSTLNKWTLEYHLNKRILIRNIDLSSRFHSRKLIYCTSHTCCLPLHYVCYSLESNPYLFVPLGTYLCTRTLTWPMKNLRKVKDTQDKISHDDFNKRKKLISYVVSIDVNPPGPFLHGQTPPPPPPPTDWQSFWNQEDFGTHTNNIRKVWGGSNPRQTSACCRPHPPIIFLSLRQMRWT